MAGAIGKERVTVVLDGTRAAVDALSYYTLCKLQDATLQNPLQCPPSGLLVTDEFGNFVSFAHRPKA
jgi:hypothetical protein